MAGVSVFGYRPGDSLIHRLDPRLKLAAVALLGAVSVNAGWAGLLVLTMTLMAGAAGMGMPLRRFFTGSRAFLVLLGLIVLSRALATPGTVLIAWRGWGVTIEGLASGGLISWRLVCIMMAAAIVIYGTPVEHLSAAVTWFLGPVPWVNAQRVGVQLALVVRFIPLILHQAAAVQAAQRARCVDHARQPIRRLRLLVVPLMRRVFLGADRMSLAMAARCYSEPRTPVPMHMGRRDAAVAVLLTVVAVTAFLW